MSWRQFAWLMVALIPGTLPGFAGVFVLMDWPHINLPHLTGWLLIIQTVIFIYLCIEKFTAPAINPTTGGDDHE